MLRYTDRHISTYADSQEFTCAPFTPGVQFMLILYLKWFSRVTQLGAGGFWYERAQPMLLQMSLIGSLNFIRPSSGDCVRTIFN